MRRLFSPVSLLCVAGVLALFTPSPGRAQTATSTSVVSPVKIAEPNSATLTLRWLKPSQFVAALTTPMSTPISSDDDASLLPSGLLRVSPDDVARRVFVQGTPEAVSAVQQIAQLLDVNPRRIQLTVRILRAPANQFAVFAEPDQKLRKGEVVSNATAVFKNNEAITLHAVGGGQTFHIPLIPHIFSDGSVAIAVDVSELPASAFAPPAPANGSSAADSLNGNEAKKETSKEASRERRIRSRRVNAGAKLLVASKPYWRDSGLAYYLEITPVVLESLESSENP